MKFKTPEEAAKFKKDFADAAGGWRKAQTQDNLDKIAKTFVWPMLRSIVKADNPTAAPGESHTIFRKVTKKLLSRWLTSTKHEPYSYVTIGLKGAVIRHFKPAGKRPAAAKRPSGNGAVRKPKAGIVRKLVKPVAKQRPATPIAAAPTTPRRRRRRLGISSTPAAAAPTTPASEPPAATPTA